MPRIQCPHCQHWLKLPREARNAKLKCSHCEAVFTGSSGPDAPAAATQPQDPAAALAAAAPHARQEAPRSQGPQVKVVTVYRRKESAAPVFITVVVGLLLIPVIIMVVYGATHKHVVLKDPSDRVVLDAWLPNEEALAAVEQNKKKYEKGAPPSPGASAEGGGPTGKGPHTGNVSEGGAVGVSDITGDTNFALELVKVYPDEVGTSGRYTGLVRNQYDKPVEEVVLTLRHGGLILSPVALHWLAPNGVVPFTVEYNNLEPVQAKKDPTAVFSKATVRKDMGGYEIPAGQPEYKESEDSAKTITLKGDTVNHTSSALRSAKLYVDFTTDNGLVQTTEKRPDVELKPTDLAPEGKAEYLVTWTPMIPGTPHLYFLRVIGNAGN